jgi:Tfp pilus assembly protein PilX
MLSNQRGIALPLTLMILAVMTGLALGLLALSATEPVIARNLVDATQARLVAEAGLEFAFNQLASTADWNTILVNADAGGLVTLAAVSAMPTATAAQGTYTVTVRNDTIAGDDLITGVALDAGTPTTDTNNRVIVTALGVAGNATRTLRVVIKRATLPPFPAALNFPGNEAESRFNGNTFNIDGNDWKEDGTPGTCAPVYGVSVSPTLGAPAGQNEIVVENSVAANQKDNVKGKKQVAAGQAWGNNTIAPEPDLTPAVIDAFIKDVKKAADMTLESKQPNGLSFNNVGSTCAADWNSQTCWGTADHPKIVYIKGDVDPTSAFAALQLSGNTEGHGILIVEDGDLRFSGTFTWHGPVIVTGQYVGVGFLGGGNQTIFGSVISNEMRQDPGFFEGWVSGNVDLRYSCEAINKMRALRKLVTMTNWQEL